MLLAQSDKTSQAWGGLLWIAAAVAATTVALLIARHLGKRWWGSLDKPAPSFTLAELRKMRDQGDVTAAEYEALKKKIVERTTI